VLAALAPDHPPFSPADLVAEGFDQSAGPGLAAASTMLIPRVPPPAAATPAGPKAVRTRRLRWLPVSAALLVGLLMLAGIVVAVATSSDSPRPPTVASTQQSGPVVDGVAYSPKGVVKDGDCAVRAIGDIQAWLQSHPCTSLVRARYESSADKEAVAVLVADIAFADAATAGEFLKVADTPGTGSIADLATDGTPWPDGHKPVFASAAYKTKLANLQVRIVQAVWLSKPSTATDPALLTAATRALNLPGA
jgi:hypothetical protein